ncbi:MAG: DUF4838 domain-containing protein [Planctomycetota bacterium]|jgi:hypothetical protein
MKRAIMLSALASAFVFACTVLHSEPQPPGGEGGPASDNGALVIADNGKSEFKIIVPEEAPPSTKYAAEELRKFIAQITDVKLPVATENADTGGGPKIILGKSSCLEALGIDLANSSFGDEGYMIRTAGKHLVIAGGEPRGTLYGVYGFLEDHLGCRWFTRDVSRIPKRKRLVIPELHEVRKPVFEYRCTWLKECLDPDWSARNRLNGSRELIEKHGGFVKFWRNRGGHTFRIFVPPDKYFDEHPEYFSLVQGKRVKDKSQICCTNEDVIRIVTEGVLKGLREHPGCSVIHVSQNDNFRKCECEKCRALSEKEESDMAPVLRLVNHVAEAVEKEFSGVSVMTFAYQWTRKPPKTIRPRPNVIIQLCSIECCFAHPLATCDCERNRNFVRDLEGWSKICDRLWIWNYNTSFPQYLLPFPNQRVRDDNIKLFLKHNAKGVFEQDCYNTTGSEFAELGGYMAAKFLWNPDYGEDRAMNEFLDGVYGKAAPFIRKYIDMLHDKSEKENIHNNIWIGYDHPHLDGTLLAEADGLFELAEKKVSDTPDVLKRVRIARLSVDFVILERARAGLWRNYSVDHKNFVITPDPVVVRRFGPFFEALKLSGLTRLDEWHKADLKKYRKDLSRIAEEIRLEPVSPVRAGNVTQGINYDYYEGKWQALPVFSKLEPVHSGFANSIDLSPCRSIKSSAVRFTGYIEILTGGVYTFFTNSSAGSRLYIGEKLIVDNDGHHYAQQRAGLAALKSGLHPVTITSYHSWVPGALSVSYEGPGIKFKLIPESALFRKKRE